MYDPLRAKARVVLFTATAFLFGLGLASGLGWTSPSHAMPAIAVAPQVSPEAVQPALDLSEAFTNLAEAVTPAVVRIESRRREAVQPNQRVPEGLRNFFDLPDTPQEPRERVAGGTGFIVSEDGYILTNNHVVEGAEEVTVHFLDRSYFDAQVVGTDPYTDVAVIKIDAGHPVPAMSFGNSDGVKVGEWILAIGNPGFGGATQLNFTVTAGIVSARGRGLQLLQNDLEQDPRYGREASQWAIEDFIQTDAVINPGNSGGPMINLHGQVVGINSAIASETGVYQGYGFAIPINLARRVMEDLIEYGHVRRPRLGVQIREITAEDAEIYQLPSISGVLVQDVQEDGPARGILQFQDVIVAIDGAPVSYVAELQGRIAEHRPGERVEVAVYRNGRRQNVTIQLADAPINDVAPVVAQRSALSDERLGINIAPLDAQRATELGYDEATGVVLTDVAPGSVAQRRGVGGYVNWKLVEVADRSIERPDDVRATLDDVAAGAAVKLMFENPSGERRVINIRMPS